jgi:hypothetical protein
MSGIEPSFSQKALSIWVKILYWCSRPAVLLAVIMIITAAARFSLLLPGNAFITDEAYYIGAGVEILMAKIEAARHYYQYTTGCVYIFPFIAAAAAAFFERFGISGVVGVRLLNIAISTITVAFVHQTSRILSNRWIENTSTRKWMPPFAGLIFGLSSCVLYISTLGTYDALSLAFLSFGIWRLVRAVLPLEEEKDESQHNTFVRNLSQTGNAAAAGILIGLGMITRYFPVVFTPLLALILIVSLLYLIRDRRNKTAFLLIVFIVAFLAVYGSYFVSSYTTAIKPALDHNQANVDRQDAVPALKLIMHVFNVYGAETILAIIGAIWLSSPAIIRLASGNMKPADLKPWDRLFQMAPFILIPMGGIAFQIIGTHNYFAYTKNLAVPIMAMAPLAGFAAAKLIELFPRRFIWFGGIVYLWLIGLFTMHAIEKTKIHQIAGGLNNADFIQFIKKQLSDESFGLRYRDFQNAVASKLDQILPYLAIILVALFVIFLLLKVAHKFYANQI